MTMTSKKTKKIIGLKDLRENMGAYIRQVERGHSFTVVRRSRPVFKLEPVDEWGDDGAWETVVDLRKLDSHSVPLRDVIASLKRLNAQAR
jgi:prevent-host-death family protein